MATPPTTTPTSVSVGAFLNTVEDPGQGADCAALRSMMQEVSGQPATMWGPAIVGFGQYHYRYASGREGDTFQIGFSPRKQKLSVYLAGGASDQPGLLAKLGKHKTGAGCLWIKRLTDVDQAVLREMCAAAMVWRATDGAALSEQDVLGKLMVSGYYFVTGK